MVTQYMEDTVRPSDLENLCTSPCSRHTGSVALNYKGLAYRTEWVEYPDIAPLLSRYNVPPNPPPETPHTLPVIYDPRTRSFVTDSTDIALYLDRTYPDTPPLMPEPLHALQAAFGFALRASVHQALRPLMMFPAMNRLHPRGHAFFRETRELSFGCKMEEICPPEKQAAQWACVEKAFGQLTSWFEAAGDGRLLLLSADEGRICHADTQILGLLKWVQAIFGPDSEEWRRLETFDDGRWKRFLTVMAKWTDTTH